MKKSLVVGLLIFYAAAFAAPPAELKTSAEPLLGALRGVFGSEYLYTAYVPGSGVQFMAFGGSSEPDVTQLVAGAREVMTALAGTVTGLPKGERLTLVYTDYYDGESVRDIVVSLDPLKPGDVEASVGGEPANP